MDAMTLLATFVGALVQVAIGIGFSVVAGPVFVIASGAKNAVPMLLALNVVVSCIGIYGFRLERGAATLGQSIGGALVGIVIGASTFPYLSEAFVTVAIAVILLCGSLSGWVSSQREGWKTIACAGTIAGLATAWTATPGPVMSLGLILAGHQGAKVRLLVQPISLVTYGLAFGLLGSTAWSAVANAPNLAWLILAAVVGSLLGLLVGPHLPSPMVIPAIRVFSAIGGLILLSRAIG